MYKRQGITQTLKVALEAVAYCDSGLYDKDKILRLPESFIIENEINIQRIESSEFTISKRVYVAIDDDEERAENRLRRWFEGNYGNSDMAVNVSVWGSTEKVIEDLQKVIGAGAQMLMLNPVFDHMWHLSMLREEVIPHLRRIG